MISEDEYYDIHIRPRKLLKALKRKAAAQELIALGMTEQSARLIAEYHGPL